MHFDNFNLPFPDVINPREKIKLTDYIVFFFFLIILVYFTYTNFTFYFFEITGIDLHSLKSDIHGNNTLNFSLEDVTNLYFERDINTCTTKTKSVGAIPLSKLGKILSIL